jgi:hypothetical protein
MLERFPAQASKTFIMSSAKLVEEYASAKFYGRPAI